MDKMNFQEPKFWGFGVTPFGVVDIWWVDISKCTPLKILSLGNVFLLENIFL